MWKNRSTAQELSRNACKEAESKDVGTSFDGTCSVIFSEVIPGVAISVRLLFDLLPPASNAAGSQ